jgi:hypothetical protein
MICCVCKKGGDMLYTKEFIPFHRDCGYNGMELFSSTEVFNSLPEQDQLRILDIAYKPTTFTPNTAEAFHIMEMIEEGKTVGTSILTVIHKLIADNHNLKSEAALKRKKEMLEAQKKERKRKLIIENEEVRQAFQEGKPIPDPEPIEENEPEDDGLWIL